MLAATKEEIFSTFSDPCVFFPLAAREDVGENSRLGFARKTVALHQGAAPSNLRTALRDRRNVAWNSQRMSLLPQSQQPNGTKTCNVSARLLQGNASKIGQPGGFSGNTPAKNVYVTAKGAAVISSQWGGKGALRPYLSQISGVFPTVGASFQGIVDVIGGKPPKGFPPNSNTGQDLMQIYPNQVIIELPGAPKDYGTAPAPGTIRMPSGAQCPG